MTDKEKILAKIELLLNEINYEPFTDVVLGKIESLKDLKSYIDSLREESISEVVKERLVNAFNDANKWQKEQMIEKVCKWIENNFHNYANNAFRKEYLVNDFKTYMKGE